MGASKQLKQAEAQQQGIASTQLQQSGQLYGQAQTAFGKRSDLLSKPTQFYTDVASGDPTKILTAAAIPLAQIAKQSAGAKASIEDTVAPGAARNFALAGLKRDAAGQSANFLNQAYLSSFPALQGLATDQGNFGLQQLGAGTRQLEGASQSNNSVINTEVQKRQAKLNTIGTFAGIAGGAIGAGGIPGLMKGFGGGSGGGTMANGPGY